MTRSIRTFTALVTGAVVVALHSGGGPMPARAQSNDPCATIGSLATERSDAAQTPPSSVAGKTRPLEHDRRDRLDGLWAHRAALATGRVRPTSVRTRAQDQDVGDVVVLQDEGDLLIKPNPLDLADAGLRFVRNEVGYDVSKPAYGFRQSRGSNITLGDDDVREQNLPFPFAFYGQSYNRVFIHSDGNLTFGESDAASTERSISRFLSGPPRIAPLFADLNPSAGGRVVTSSDMSAFSVTWCGVPLFQSARVATVQVSLLADGSIEMQVSNRTTIRETVIGVSPGRTTEFVPIDLSAVSSASAGQSAIGERFTTASDVDTVATARRFLATHPDTFDNIVLFTDTPLLANAFAYEMLIANSIRGLNIATFDDSEEFGSAGVLQSIVNMDALSKYPDDPREKVFGENSTVSVLGQEVGHRWLAFMNFRDANGRLSQALLGRDLAHWSFFFDSDASVMEGNDIEDLGGGAFRTVAAVERYSLLDQYAMGLIDQSEVPPFFYVQAPTNVVPPRAASSNPQVGVTFNGTRRTVRIEDVIAALGSRVPSAADSPRVYRQAFVYVVSQGKSPSQADIDKLDRIRVAWDQFFSAATDFRMRAETRLPRATE